VIAVDPKSPPPVLQVMAYSGAEFVERTIAAHELERLKDYVGHYKVTWVNVDGLGDERVIRELGEMFGLHSLALEDVINVHQRAKVEPYDNYLFIVARMLHENDQLETEQLSMFLGKDVLLTFQHMPGDCLDPVRQRVRRSVGRMRASGPDYLAYCLLDAVVDHYFPILEHLGDQLDALEEQAMLRPTRHTIQEIHNIKQELLIMRRAIWPHREAINALARDENPLVQPETHVYLRDCYDHVIQIMDLVETYRERGSDLRDVYLSSLSNRMNEIMRVLTVIATIFIPLTFITSIYGMNFDTQYPLNMPELRWPYGYVSLWGVMLVVTVWMVGFFWRKGWIGSQLPTAADEKGPEAHPRHHDHA
jgi:magnesium transporter